MASFRETAVPITCSECGTRALVPPGRPGLRTKCPKCGSVLKAAPTAAANSGASPPRPLESVPTATLAPTSDVVAEIDALLFGDLPSESPAKDAPKSVPAPEAPIYAIPPTEIPPVEMPRTSVVAFDPPAESDEYKLSHELGPLPLPPPLPATAFAPPPHAPQAARGEHDFRLSVQKDLPEAAGLRMQHLIDAAALDDDADGDGTTADRYGAGGHGSGKRGSDGPGAVGDRLLKTKGEKFTPDATLADPRRAFLRGVFEFPFYFEVLPQWIKLAFALTMELTLAWWIVATMKESSGGGFWDGGGIAIGSLLMLAPAILLGCIGVAMTWAVGSAIIEETAAGMNHIENWPESLVLDDLPSLVFPAMAMFLAALPGVAINWLSKNSVSQIWIFAPISAMLLFPFTLLSILETGSVFVPFSMPVFRCVYKRPGTWIWFYAESTAIVAAAAGIGVLLWPPIPWTNFSFARIAFAAVLLTAAILIYFRLLGRLALVCANQAVDWSAGEATDAEDEAEKNEELQHLASDRPA
jgi:hypothetical protein